MINSKYMAIIALFAIVLFANLVSPVETISKPKAKPTQTTQPKTTEYVAKSTAYQHGITTNVTNILLGNYGLQYEYMPNSKFGIRISYAIGGYTSTYQEDENDEYSDTYDIILFPKNKLTLEGRYYFSDTKANCGSSITPMISFQPAPNEYYEEDGGITNIGFSWAYTWRSKSGFTTELFTTLKWAMNVPAGFAVSPISLGLNLGYSF